MPRTGSPGCRCTRARVAMTVRPSMIRAICPVGVRYDLPRLGRLDGLDVVHLQCHIGTDTISLSRLGARSVVGLDFSPSALREARALAGRAGAEVRFVDGDAYDAVELLGAH